MVGYRALIWGITLLGTLNQAKKLCLGTVSTCSMSFCCWRCKQLYNSAIFVINLHDVNSEAFWYTSALVDGASGRGWRVLAGGCRGKPGGGEEEKVLQGLQSVSPGDWECLPQPVVNNKTVPYSVRQTGGLLKVEHLSRVEAEQILLSCILSTGGHLWHWCDVPPEEHLSALLSWKINWRRKGLILHEICETKVWLYYSSPPQYSVNLVYLSKTLMGKCNSYDIFFIMP